jgi:hypothetical protein
MAARTLSSRWVRYGSDRSAGKIGLDEGIKLVVPSSSHPSCTHRIALLHCESERRRLDGVESRFTRDRHAIHDQVDSITLANDMLTFAHRDDWMMICVQTTSSSSPRSRSSCALCPRSTRTSVLPTRLVPSTLIQLPSHSTMGGVPSSPLTETVSDHCAHCLDAARALVRQSWISTNAVCSNSICSAIWPTRWAQAAEESDIAYLPVGMRLDASGEQFQYASNSAASTPQRPMPYLSQPRDRALYAIDDDEEAISAMSPPNAVPHYSYRPHDLPIDLIAPPTQPQSASSQPSPAHERARLLAQQQERQQQQSGRKKESRSSPSRSKGSRTDTDRRCIFTLVLLLAVDVHSAARRPRSSVDRRDLLVRVSAVAARAWSADVDPASARSCRRARYRARR